MIPTDVPTDETERFVSKHLPRSGSRILEVGCGEGALAARLKEVGHEVIGLDNAPEVLAAANVRGVSTRQASWPDYTDDPFAVILFTRSLHHISPLDDAVQHAHALLRPGGRLIVEDFDFHGADAQTITWLYRLLSILNETGILALEKDSFCQALIESKGALTAWHDNHRHELHTALAMENVMRQVFASVRARPLFVPFHLPHSPRKRGGHADPTIDPCHGKRLLPTASRLAYRPKIHRKSLIDRGLLFLKPMPAKLHLAFGHITGVSDDQVLYL